MTDAQRIGQLFMIGLRGDALDRSEEAAISDAHIGSVVFTERTSIGVDPIRALTDAVQARATLDATDRIGFLVAANQEGGQIQTLTGPGFSTIPSAVDQGAMSAANLRTMAAQWGAELGAAGVNLDLAPVAGVVPAGTESQNIPIGSLDREYGSTPAAVARHVAAFVDGMDAAGIATTAKHFPGLGRVAGNTDFTADVVDTVTVRSDPFLRPFTRAVNAGVPFVMVSLATYRLIDPDHLAVFSPTIIEGILKGDLGFDGVVMSDALGATAVRSIKPTTRAIDFVGAGGDMIIVNQTAQAVTMAAGLVARSAADATFHARVDDAVRHVLRAKEAAGLLPC
jgi:beta-N-acetylhexosaminidase